MRGSPAELRRAELSAIDSKKEGKARLHELVWVAGCVTAPAAWVSGPGALASRGPWGRRCRGTRDPARSRGRPWVGDAGVYTDRLKRPLGSVSGHLCTLLRHCGQTWGRRSVHRLAKMASRHSFGSFVYTVAPPVATQAAAAGASGAAASLALQASRGGRVVTEGGMSCWVYLELSSIHADGGEAP